MPPYACIFKEQALDLRIGTRRTSPGSFRTRGTCQSQFCYRWRPTQNSSHATPSLSLLGDKEFPLSVCSTVNFCTFKSFHSFSLAHLQFPNIVFKIWRWKLDSNMGFINVEHCEWIILWFLCVTFWLMQPQIMFSFLITAPYIADSYPWVTGWEWLFACRILTCQFHSLWWLG